MYKQSSTINKGAFIKLKLIATSQETHFIVKTIPEKPFLTLGLCHHISVNSSAVKNSLITIETSFLCISGVS